MTKLTDDNQRQAYLDQLARCGLVTPSLRAAGVSRSALLNWRKDKAFADAEDEAKEEAADALELEARRRAEEGVERERVIGSGDSARFITETQYSDTLMLAMLKATRPEKFAERTKSEISGPGGGSIEVNDTNAAARVAALMDAARRRKELAADEPDPFS